jgi:thioredoxin-dependent peroxiredoxin
MLNSKAPDFLLESSTGQKVRLADFEGSFVVLVFYPANETPVCNRQLSEMNVNLDQFLTHNTRVFGVNTASAENHKGYCERRRLQFPILSDPGGKVAKQYGAQMKWMPMFIKRTVVAIAPNGDICFYKHGKPDPQDVLEAIEKYQANPSNL